VNFEKFTSSRFHNHCTETGCKSIIGQQESCILYSLFCIFITIINSSIRQFKTTIEIPFQPMSFPFCLFPFHPTGVGMGRGE